MSATGQFYVEDIAAALAVPYTSVRVYRGSTSDPNTAAFTTLVTTITLVSGTLQYSFTDSAATASTLWRTSYYNTTTFTESGLGPIFRPSSSNTLRLIRLEAARQAGAGFDSTCSALGTTTTLIDAGLQDSGVDTGFLEGAWVYRPDAAATGDKVRRVKKAGFTTASGTLTFDRAYTNAPANAEVYQVFQFFPPIDQPGVPYSWDRAARAGLEMCWYVDKVNLGVGTSTRQTRFSLASFPDINRETFRQVWLRTTDTNSIITDISGHTNGRWVQPVEDPATAFSLDIYPAPSTTQTVIVEALRTDAALYVDTDTTSVPLRLATAATIYQVYERLAMLQPSKYAGEFAVAQQEYDREQQRNYPGMVIIGA